MLDRQGGTKRTEETFNQHRSGIKVFLKSFSKAALQNLSNIGKAGGLVDKLLASKRWVHGINLNDC